MNLFFFLQKRIKGGGTENSLYYNCIVNNFSLMELKDIFESWRKLYELMEQKTGDDVHWFSKLEETEWLTVRKFKDLRRKKNVPADL